MGKGWMASAAACVVLVTAAAGEQASVQLADRRVVIADLTESDEQVELQIGEQSITLHRDLVRKIAWHRDSDGEYAARSAKLANDDLEGHFALAEWSADRLRYELAIAQCDHVLQRDPKYSNAAVMRDFLEIRLVRDLSGLAGLAAKPPEPDKPPKPAAPGAVQPLPLLDEQMIQRLRLAELQDDPPERVRVVLLNNVDRRFLQDVEGTTGYETLRERQRFLRGSPRDKLYAIMRTGRLEDYAADIRIEGEPRVFVEFRRFVWPIVRRNCATTACHGGANAAGFRLCDNQPLSVPELYTSFLTLDQQTVVRANGDTQIEYHLIDRDSPQASLLLHYLIAPKDTEQELQHPGELKLKYGIRSRDSREYRRLEDWIKSLKFPHPGYGLRAEEAEAEEEEEPAD